MQPNQLTEKSQQALEAASGLAAERGGQAIEPAHLLLALLGQEDGMVPPLLQAAGVSLSDLEARITSAVDGMPRISGEAAPGWPSAGSRSS